MEKAITNGLISVAYTAAVMGVGIAIILGGWHNLIIGALAGYVGRVMQTNK